MGVLPESRVAGRLDKVRNLAIKSAHFIGICGAGMNPIAQSFLTLGISVSGSDQDPSKGEVLRQAGAILHGSHVASNVGTPDVVVYSSAIPADNPEMLEARRKGITLLHRSEALAGFLARKMSILVAGTHGKTSTTAFLSLILAEAGADPWSFVGGRVREFSGNLRLGNSDIAVAEADESDGSFLVLPREHAVITNIEPEHLDYWGDGDTLFNGFVDFIQGIPADGHLSVYIDDPGIQRLLSMTGATVIPCSLEDPTCTWYAGEISGNGSSSSYTLHHGGAPIGRVQVGVPGRHNIVNSLVSFALAHTLGFPVEKALNALKDFRGVDRRFTHYPSSGGWLVIDDYAHHTTEIATTMATARLLADERGGRLFAVLQPHRFSRTREFLHGFGPSLTGADEVVVMDVYAAGEAFIPGLDGKGLAKVIGDVYPGKIHIAPEIEDVKKILPPMLKKGDIVLLLGAGSVTRLANLLAPAPITPDVPVPEVS
ncbi:MAG: UDP-N-acetylmuramate--L-alanine ligase [Candidatus Sumerlaeia bacterium]|nr:UDP-N-acetylmuramate--L-alanine ligase [Candidatus Sumerlaeia bacterium]